MTKTTILNRTGVLAVGLLGLLVAGRDSTPQTVGTSTSGDLNYDRICIDGVEYLRRRVGHTAELAAHFKTDGSLYLCGTNAELYKE